MSCERGRSDHNANCGEFCAVGTRSGNNMVLKEKFVFLWKFIVSPRYFGRIPAYFWKQTTRNFLQRRTSKFFFEKQTKTSGYEKWLLSAPWNSYEEPSIYRCHSLSILRDGHGHRRIYGNFPLADSTKKLRQYLKMFSDATTWWNTAPTNPQRFVSTVQTEGLNTKKTRRCYSKNPRYMMKRRQIIYKARSKNPKT